MTDTPAIRAAKRIEKHYAGLENDQPSPSPKFIADIIEEETGATELLTALQSVCLNNGVLFEERRHTEYGKIKVVTLTMREIQYKQALAAIAKYER